MPETSLPEHVRDLTAAVEGEVRLSRHDRMLYATDASVYQVEPLAVVIPSSVEDAVRAVRFCSQRGLPVLPRGGGTSLAGQCTNRAVVLDFSVHCRGVVEVEARARWCRVEPGITIDDLNDVLRPTGLFFAPDPATSRQANVGGCIGNNAAGARSIVYGRTSENLLGVEICTAGGERLTLEEGAAVRDARVGDLTRRVVDVVRRHKQLIRDRFPRTIRRNAGYALDMILAQLDAGGGDLSRVNLASLLCGSEGTLGVTLGARLRLHPIPAARGLAVISFETLDEAIDAVVPILSLSPSAVELLDDLVVSLASANHEYRRYVDLLPRCDGREVAAVLYVEFTAREDRAELEEKFASLRATVGAGRTACYTDAGAMLAAWKLRKAGEPLLHGIPGRRKPITFVEDNAVPPENLAEFVRRFRAIVERHGTRAAFWAHASVGVLHVRPLLDISDADDRRRMTEMAVEVADLAREMGGVMSGEHGDGRVRGPLLERYFGPELMLAFREIKGIFDPRNLLNPGNIVEPGPIESITAHLRVRPEEHEVRVPAVETFYRYEDQHGFDAALETCNGAGVCRKKSGGTMCPSYQGTLDERHSTRGRGNALRLAITGQFSGRHPGWNDPETLKTLDLCLSCKACKSECPSNVDVARLKAEYLAQSDRASGGPTLRRRVFGHIHLVNRLAAMAPGLANAINGSRLGKRVLAGLLDVDPRRSMPAFHGSLRRRWKAMDAASQRQQGGSAGSPGNESPTVVLLVDTFTAHNEPEIALDARRVLEGFGYQVELYLGSDFGRALISQGLLRQAIADAEGHIDRLWPMVQNEAGPILLTLEPSCQSAIVDDWADLRISRPRERIERIRARTRDLCDFLEQHWNEHPRTPAWRALDAPVAIHGHCHQKALFGTGAARALLQRFTTGTVMELETGCCGMAGAFGFSRGHFDLSRQIADLSIVPRIAALSEDTLVAASGTSCRHQVRDFCRRSAVHPIQFIAGVVADCS
ncbi:MAG: FAD-binding protein [Phycisphaerales bacterium]|nr:FAD-binding protein [Phycisphaerales bacterium]